MTYQATDLTGTKRIDFIRDARAGRARLRDKDGLTLVMLPESELDVLEQFAHWSQVHQRVASILDANRNVTVSDGDLAWLRVFERDDLQEFANELHGALVLGLADRDSTLIDDVVSAWKVTAKQLEDPLRRSVLFGAFDANEYVEVSGLDVEGE
jgi:hypothetical protein